MKKILLIEDDHRLSTSIKKGLIQESYSVDVKHDGIEGLDYASTGNYDVIILDLMLPGMDGIEICKNLRKNNIHTPILMLTAKSELEDKIEGLNSGADDYLPKPFAFEELLARTKALTRRSKVISDSILKCGNLSLNSDSFEVFRDSEEIFLSKKEFSLLEYLMRNKNKIVSKDQIVEHVWDYDSDILPNTVEQYIGYLRNKIDKPFKNDLQMIKTIRGFGYKISE